MNVNTAYDGYVDKFLDDSDASVINFKLLEKPCARKYSQQDFQLIESTIMNLESLLPSNQRRSKSSGRVKSSKRVKTISQKQILDTLDQTLYTSKVHKHLEFGDVHHVRRLLLKIHQILVRVKQPMTHAQQIELLLKFLNYEMTKIETQMMADQTYSTCLLQKTFVALLDHMATQVEERQQKPSTLNTQNTQKKSRNT